MERGRTFETVAAVYDAQRSGYPPALFDDVVAYAGLKPGHRVLEIGCGSGQATQGFLDQGLDVTAVDPGAALVDLARAKFRDVLVRFEVTPFEAWEPAGLRFRLVAAAQSWHWLRQQTAFVKAAQALASDGALALFGHTPVWSQTLMAQLAPVYARFAPELRGPPPEAWYLPDGPILKLINASGLFGDLNHCQYFWRRRYKAAAFCAYLGTRSDHLLLQQDRREDLLRAVENALPDNVDADWTTNLYLARNV